MLKRLTSEDGFTMVEMVWSVVIFLIAFMAIMTLTMASLDQALLSTKKADLVNAVGSYIEQVRARPAVTPPSSVTAGDVTITLSSSKTWMSDSTMTTPTAAYRKLVVTGTATRGASDSHPMTYTAETILP